MQDQVKKTKRKPTGAAAMGAGPGRPKGIPNKMTMAVKDVIAEAAERLGGVDRMVDWAKEDPVNEREFWARIYPKLLPLQVTGAGGGPIESTLNVSGLPTDVLKAIIAASDAAKSS